VGRVDYLVSGTAVRLPGAVKATWPILTDLTVQEYWKLYQAGWSPVGLVAATSVFFVSQSMGTQWMRRLTAIKNQELTEYSRGFYAARATAVRYLQSQASAAGASGIVGVQLEHDITREKFRVATGYYPQGIAYSAQRQQGAKDERDGLAVTIHAVGTAIRHDEPVQRYPPEPIVNLQEV
jgi:uncharacterized protein YbjQ (UPF0145 family)